MKNVYTKLVALGVVAAVVAAPAISSADNWRDHRDARNEWKGLATVSAVVGVAGLASGNRDAAVVGCLAAAYSAYRLGADRCVRPSRPVIVEPIRIERFPARYHDRDHGWRR